MRGGGGENRRESVLRAWVSQQELTSCADSGSSVTFSSNLKCSVFSNIKQQQHQAVLLFCYKSYAGGTYTAAYNYHHHVCAVITAHQRHNRKVASATAHKGALGWAKQLGENPNSSVCTATPHKTSVHHERYVEGQRVTCQCVGLGKKLGENLNSTVYNNPCMMRDMDKSKGFTCRYPQRRLGPGRTCGGCCQQWCPA